MNILGVEYELKIDESLAEVDQDGVCRAYSKEILIRPASAMLEKDDTADDKGKRFREVLRHEITHAALYESGLQEYADDELLVVWIAKQYPKLDEIFRKYGCAEEGDK